MAHYVAELIDEAERAPSPRKRSALRRECAEVIQRLWDRRSHWPSGWPPDSAARLTEALDSTEPNRRRLSPSEGLAAALPALLEIHRNEAQAWLDSILLATDTSSEETWLKDWTEEMKEDELHVLHKITALKLSALWRFDLQPPRNQSPRRILRSRLAFPSWLKVLHRIASICSLRQSKPFVSLGHTRLSPSVGGEASDGIVGPEMAASLIRLENRGSLTRN